MLVPQLSIRGQWAPTSLSQLLLCVSPSQEPVVITTEMPRQLLLLRTAPSYVLPLPWTVFPNEMCSLMISLMHRVPSYTFSLSHLSPTPVKSLLSRTLPVSCSFTCFSFLNPLSWTRDMCVPRAWKPFRTLCVGSRGQWLSSFQDLLTQHRGGSLELILHPQQSLPWASLLRALCRWPQLLQVRGGKGLLLMFVKLLFL